MKASSQCPRADRPPVCAVVVTYFPDEGLRRRIEAIADECDRVIVVDNASSPDSIAGLQEIAETIELMRQSRNVGLATALNIGLVRALELGFAWAVTFDQDSTPQRGMVAALWNTREHAAFPDRVAVVGPRLTEERIAHEDHRWVVPHPRCRWLFRRMPCRDVDLPGVAFVITSGALMDLQVFRQIGPMADELFIDYIDHDYCLRARQYGYEVIVSAAALLVHNLGAKREFRIGSRPVRPTFHSPLRLRYMLRNRRLVLRRYARAFPHWALFDAIFTHYNLVRVVLFEDRRREKISAALRGMWDGLLHRTGTIAS